MARFDQVAGFILAGGASSRMGRDKALLEIAGVPMLLRTARLLEPLVGSVTVIGPRKSYASLSLHVVPDDEGGLGPLGGISTALRISSAGWNLVVGCDLPYLTEPWLACLVSRGVASKADAAIPVTIANDVEWLQPLCAMYHKRCAPTITAALARGVRKVSDALASLAVEKLTPADWKAFDSGGLLFKNMHSPEDFEEARARLSEKRNK